MRVIKRFCPCGKQYESFEETPEGEDVTQDSENICPLCEHISLLEKEV